MIIRLTAACNNRCFFCIVDDEIASTSFRPTEDLLAEVDAAPPAETIDIFGGEPTIDPSFWAVLARAVSTGRRVTIASNVRLFANRKLAQRLADTGRSQIVVRTTLMGPTAEIHDPLNGVRNAFRQTVAGIENLSALGIEVRTNVVVLRENIDQLLATALVAHQAGSRSVKFSGAVRTEKFRDSIPDPGHVRAALEQALSTLGALGVRTSLEKLPLCVAGAYALQVQPEQANLIVGSPHFRRTPRCDQCALKSGCPGGELGALERFGDGWMQPFVDLPEDWVVDVDWRELPAFDPPDNPVFVRIDRGDATFDDLVELVANVAALNERCPGATVL